GVAGLGVAADSGPGAARRTFGDYQFSFARGSASERSVSQRPALEGADEKAGAGERGGDVSEPAEPECEVAGGGAGVAACICSDCGSAPPMYSVLSTQYKILNLRL